MCKETNGGDRDILKKYLGDIVFYIVEKDGVIPHPMGDRLTLIDPLIVPLDGEKFKLTGHLTYRGTEFHTVDGGHLAFGMVEKYKRADGSYSYGLTTLPSRYDSFNLANSLAELFRLGDFLEKNGHNPLLCLKTISAYAENHKYTQLIMASASVREKLNKFSKAYQKLLDRKNKKKKVKTNLSLIHELAS